ncbi:MAG: hypothetical protein RL251_1397, partial [Pseudomonadota bacterium]
MKLFYPILAAALLASACSAVPVAARSATTAPARSLTSISQDYVRLTLEAGTHEAEYVDAYYGPEALQAAAKASPRSLADLITEARKLTAAIDASSPTIKDDA